MQDRVFRGDTALVEASLYDEDGVTPLPATWVDYSIKKPDGDVFERTTVPVEQSLVSIAFGDTFLPGQYLAQITFTLNDADLTRRSTVLSFEVIDPLESTFDNPGDSPVEKTIDRAWMKLEDLFDSELGGPHLRDRTMATFSRDKMKLMLPDALYNINFYYQPQTGYTEDDFPFESQQPLLAEAILIESIRHLMRSYVEQPQPVGAGTPTYFDRRDYLSRWQQILQIEEDRFYMWLDLFKRGLMGFGHTSILVGGYASFTSRYPRYMRGRYPYIYRA